MLTLLARALPSDESDLDGRSALHYAAAALCIPPDLPGADWAAAETLLLRSINAVRGSVLVSVLHAAYRFIV